MNTRFYTLPLLLLVGAAACSSSPEYRTWEDERPVVNEKAWMTVPAEDRGDINKARTSHAEAVDGVAMAELEVKRAHERVEIAEEEVKVAKAEADGAASRVELARTGSSNNDIESAQKGWDAACARKHWARTQVIVEEGRVEHAKAKVELAKQRVSVEESKIELAKAKAVRDNGRDEAHAIDLAEFERCVADQEVALKMAEVDVDACGKKMELREDMLEERAKAVPSTYRKTLPRLADEPKG